MNPLVADLVRRSAGLALPARAGGPASPRAATPLQGAAVTAASLGAPESAHGSASDPMSSTADSPEIAWEDAIGPQADAIDAAAFEDRTSSNVVTDLGTRPGRAASARTPGPAATAIAPVDLTPSPASAFTTQRVAAAAVPGTLPAQDATRSPSADPRHRAVDAPQAWPPTPPTVASGRLAARQPAAGMAELAAPPAAVVGIDPADRRVAAKAPTARASTVPVAADPVVAGHVVARAPAAPSALAPLASTQPAGAHLARAPAAPPRSAQGAVPASTASAAPPPAVSARVWPTEPAAAAPVPAAATNHNAQAPGEVNIQIGTIEIRGAPPPPAPAPAQAPREPEGFADFDRWRCYAPWDGV